MILTAYLDEAGTHDDRIMTLGGYVGHAGQWKRFEKRWAKLLRDNDLSYFHTKPFLKGSGEFAGWDHARKMKFALRMERICLAHSLFAFAVVLRGEDFTKHYKGQSRPRKAAFESRYGVCFRLALSFLPSMLSEALGKDKAARAVLNVVMESGNSNSGAAQVIFDKFKTDAPPELARMAGAISFALKEECYGCQAADSVASPVYRQERKGNVKAVSFSFKEEDTWKDAREFARKRAPTFRLVASPNVLKELRENLIAQVEARRTYWETKHRPSAPSSATK